MRIWLLCLSLPMLIPFLAPKGFADQKDSKKDEYSSIQVLSFTAKKNLEVPLSFLVRVQKDLPPLLTGTKKFKRVNNLEEDSNASGSQAIQMIGTLIEYDPGNRAKRYLVGFGMGTAEAIAHIKLVKSGTDDAIFERDVTAKMSRGAYGGSSNALADELAKEIARVTKRTHF